MGTRSSVTRGGLVAVAAALLLPTPALAQDGQPVSRLSDSSNVSRYAFVDRATVARREPHRSSAAVARLRTRTEDSTDELVLALERTRTDGRPWVRVRLPVLPNGRTGWVPESHLSPYRRVDTWLQVDLRRQRMTLRKRGRRVFTARVGIGERVWPTPRGHFYIRNRLSGYGLGSAYGPLAFGASARSAVLTDWPGGGVVGIHGTDQPDILPGRVSHGCIRLRNTDILRLDELMPVGTPITVR